MNFEHIKTYFFVEKISRGPQLIREGITFRDNTVDGVAKNLSTRFSILIETEWSSVTGSIV